MNSGGGESGLSSFRQRQHAHTLIEATATLDERIGDVALIEITTDAKRVFSVPSNIRCGAEHH